ncbi:hypothetical protein ACWDR9_15880 [Streptosporangium sandarakinum]|uniref:hypothetical protein n=1 Tax=Streptosporangium sandarakinum TaxID=1260955 RepID=UPI003692F588
MVDDHHVVLATQEKHPTLLNYDIRSRTYAVLGQLPKSAAYHSLQASGVVGSRIVWVSRSGYGGHPRSEVWAVSSVGGPVERLATLPQVVNLTGGRIQAWESGIALWTGQSAFFIPSTGRPIKFVKVPQGYTFTDWPWMYDGQGVLKNAISGKFVHVEGGPDGKLSCGSDWCIGRGRSDSIHAAKVSIRNTDGSKSSTLAARYLGFGLMDRRFGFFGPPSVARQGPVEIVDGFRPGSLGKEIIIYDRCTRKAASLRASRNSMVSESDGIFWGGSRNGNGPMLTMVAAWADKFEYAVFDLAGVDIEDCGKFSGT